MRIWPRVTVSETAAEVFETTDTIIDDNANGMAFVLFSEEGANFISIADRIIALGADGFTVDDGGADNHPNANGVVYNYLCQG